MPAQEPLAFLNEATERIGASVNAAGAVHELCEAMVPRLADMAAVYLSEDLTRPHDPAMENVVDPAMRRLAVVPDDPHTVSVLERRKFTDPVSAPDTPCWLPAHGEQPTVVHSSTLVMPLHAGGRRLGFAVLMREEGEEPFSEGDLFLAKLVGRQAAIIVYHAYLYEREAATVATLQRSMIPGRPTNLSGVEVAYRYLPGGHTAHVGGDWFNAIPISGSRTAFVVGDVMGHGLRAAAAMGQLRTAVTTLASLELPPDQVLRHLDDLAPYFTAHSLTTCLYCVYDPVARCCTLASAGHIPPILVHPDGHATVLSPPTGAPLGIGFSRSVYEPFEVTTPDGSLLVLCTDGLVEARGQDIEHRLQLLCRRLTKPDQPLEQICDRILEHLPTPGSDDDVTLLVARLHGIPSDALANWYLQPKAHTPAQARWLVRHTLDGWNLSPLAETTELLVSELVTNAVRYASRPIGLRLMRTERLLCEVRDDDHRLPVLRQTDATDEYGRGLLLVSELAERWGTSRTADGKVVWFTQSLPS